MFIQNYNDPKDWNSFFLKSWFLDYVIVIAKKRAHDTKKTIHELTYYNFYSTIALYDNKIT